MNLKKAKRLRRFWDGKTRPSWRDSRYTDSNHPEEKLHQKLYKKRIVKYTKAGAKTLYHEVPIKVGTVVLVPTCGRALYKETKKAS